MPSDSPTAPPSDLRVAEVLQKVRSGVRQRRAESATLAAGGMETRNGLLMLKSREYVQEPVVFSHRPRWGRLIVFARKAFFHAFLKWYVRPLLEQQNGFNQTASRLIEDLVEAHDRALRELALVSARLEALEEKPGEPAAGGDVPADRAAARDAE